MEVSNYKGNLIQESYLKKLSSHNTLKLYYFTFDISSRVFYMRKTKHSNPIQLIHPFEDILSFSDHMENNFYCFVVTTKYYKYQLFPENEKIYLDWIRILTFSFYRIDINNPKQLFIGRSKLNKKTEYTIKYIINKNQMNKNYEFIGLNNIYNQKKVERHSIPILELNENINKNQKYIEQTALTSIVRPPSKANTNNNRSYIDDDLLNFDVDYNLNQDDSFNIIKDKRSLLSDINTNKIKYNNHNESKYDVNFDSFISNKGKDSLTEVNFKINQFNPTNQGKKVSIESVFKSNRNDSKALEIGSKSQGISSINSNVNNVALNSYELSGTQQNQLAKPNAINSTYKKEIKETTTKTNIMIKEVNNIGEMNKKTEQKSIIKTISNNKPLSYECETGFDYIPLRSVNHDNHHMQVQSTINTSVNNTTYIRNEHHLNLALDNPILKEQSQLVIKPSTATKPKLSDLNIFEFKALNEAPLFIETSCINIDHKLFEPNQQVNMQSKKMMEETLNMSKLNDSGRISELNIDEVWDRSILSRDEFCEKDENNGNNTLMLENSDYIV